MLEQMKASSMKYPQASSGNNVNQNGTMISHRDKQFAIS